jgi:hypothetical protein
MSFTPRTHENGGTCCSNPEHLCPKCEQHFARSNAEADYAPPDPFTRELAVLKAASATPLSTFEDEYKASRREALATESHQRDDHFAAHPSPRLTLAELADYAAPDPYAAGIKALQLKENHR